MKISLINAPTETDWMSVKERALVTIGKTAVTPPSSEWKHKILEARHQLESLVFSTDIESAACGV